MNGIRCDFAVHELYQQEESVLTCKQGLGKNGMALNVFDFINAVFIKLHKLTF